jgi:hypothetical protein
MGINFFFTTTLRSFIRLYILDRRTKVRVEEDFSSFL